MHITAFVLIGLAIISLWVTRHRWIPSAIAGLAVACSFLANDLDLIGFIILSTLGTCCYLYYQNPSPSAKRYLGGTLILLSLGLSGHQLPGFNTWTAIAELKLSADSLVFPVEFHADKPFIGFFVVFFGLVPLRTAADWRSLLRSTLPIVILCLLVMLPCALLTGYVRIDPKFPDISVVWLLRNLLFVCVAEEALFRGLIQRNLCHQLAGKYRYGQWMGVGFAAFIFGLAHFMGGWRFIVLATIAGIFYGWAYLRTDRIEAGILVHFALNTAHFLGFSYPEIVRELA